MDRFLTVGSFLDEERSLLVTLEEKDIVSRVDFVHMGKGNMRGQ